MLRKVNLAMESILKSYNLADFSCVSFQHLNLFEVRSRARLPQNSKTAIAIIFPYYNKTAMEGNISAYCAVEDYHIVAMEQLKSICADLKTAYPQYAFEPFADASPIDEVDMAAKAGLGVKGDNSLLITEKWGSFVFIGEIVTDMETDTVLCGVKGCCHCGRCSKACPGGAVKGGVVNSADCASRISQKKGQLTERETDILRKAKTVFGCDICQKVCPHNKDICTDSNLFSRNIVNRVEKETVAQVYKSRAFGFRGLKTLERNLEIYGE